MIEVPFLQLLPSYLEIRQELDDAVGRVLSSGAYIGGAEVEAFEAEFAAFCGATAAVGVGNGLDAIRLALMALGIGPGDEVIVPSNTFIATWLAVTQCGATPVPVEPIVATHNIDLEAIAAAITPRTRAIIPVHLYGQPADLQPILELARQHGLRVVEDAAQAHGARYRGTRIGAHSDVVAWSFYPGKNLGAFGDAGAITTNDEGLAARIRMLGNYGSRTKYINEVQGLNSRLDPLQAAMLRVKLRHLEAWNARRGRVADRYRTGLAESGLTLPVVPEWADPAWHLFVVRHPQRDGLQGKLKGQGITSLIHYPVPPHCQASYADMGLRPESLPIALSLADTVLSLPMGPHLTEAAVDTVIAATRRALDDLAGLALLRAAS